MVIEFWSQHVHEIPVSVQIWPKWISRTALANVPSSHPSERRAESLDKFVYHAVKLIRLFRLTMSRILSCSVRSPTCSKMLLFTSQLFRFCLFHSSAADSRRELSGRMAGEAERDPWERSWGFTLDEDLAQGNPWLSAHPLVVDVLLGGPDVPECTFQRYLFKFSVEILIFRGSEVRDDFSLESQLSSLLNPLIFKLFNTLLSFSLPEFLTQLVSLSLVCCLKIISGWIFWTLPVLQNFCSCGVFSSSHCFS